MSEAYKKSLSLDRLFLFVVVGSITKTCLAAAACASATHAAVAGAAAGHDGSAGGAGG